MSAPTLPSFMERAMAFFGKAEANLTAADLLTAANTKIATLEAEIVTLKAASNDFTVQVTALTGDVATAKAAVAAKETELKNVQAELATAKGTANAVIASQGLATEKLPPLEPRGTAGKSAPDGKAKAPDLDELCMAAYAKRNGNGNGN